MPPYPHCPKCGHSPLPAEQSLPAACPTCGLVLAKFNAPPLQRPNNSDRDDRNQPSGLSTLWAMVTHVPEQVDRTMFWGRVALLAFFGVWGIRLLMMNVGTGELGESFLHRPLLVFHEAGHVVFIPLGEFMTIAGGTLGQLIMPAVLCGALLIKNRDPFGASIGLWLVGVSFLDIAPYAYDALQPQLMLLGGRTGEDGGPHDWMFLLTKLGLLKRAHGVGYFFYVLGLVTIALSMTWSAWLLWQQKKNVTESVL